jgi:hypothetical protein
LQVGTWLMDFCKLMMSIKFVTAAWWASNDASCFPVRQRTGRSTNLSCYMVISVAQ